jgi:hypothetical protein
MGLLELLRPAETRGWDTLDDAEQLLLLRQAQRARHLPTLRTLAELPRLAGTARTELLADREPSIRKKILNRRDLTAAETETLLAGETRASVLVSVVGSFPTDKLETLIGVAEASRGTSLTEALIRSGRLDTTQKLRMLNDLSSRRSYAKLPAGVADKVAGIVPADPKLLLWMLTDSSSSQNRWTFGRVVARIANTLTSADDALAILDTFVAAGHTEPAANLAGRLLDGDSIVANRLKLDLDQTRKLAEKLSVRLDAGTGGWDRMTTQIGAMLTKLHTMLSRMGQPVNVDVATDTAADIAWDTLTSGQIVAQLTSTTRLDAESVALLACNPNHTPPTAAKVAELVFQTPGAAVALLTRFDDVADTVWQNIASRHNYDAVITAGDTIDRVGADRLAQILSSPRYRDNGSSYRYWRTTWPLLGSGPLTWLLTGTQHPQARQTALALPVKTTLEGDEAAAFRLLAGEVGDSPAAWDVVDGLAGTWDGTYADLIAVARQINV